MQEENKNGLNNASQTSRAGCGGCPGCGNLAGPGDAGDDKNNKLKPGELAFIWGMTALLIVIAAFVSGHRFKKASEESPEGYPLSRQVFLLDTYCEITVYSGGGSGALDNAVEALNFYDGLFNKSDTGSDICKINNREGGTVEIDAATSEMLSMAKEFAEYSGFSLEPAIKPVSDLWDFKDEKKVPDGVSISRALKKVNSTGWDVQDGLFIAADSDVMIDVGAFAKGYIADRLKEGMVEEGVESAIINLGGNVLCIGVRPDGDPFRIAVMEPGKDLGDLSNITEVSDASVVTSGVYERYFEEDGVLYHHILNPATGYPVDNGLISVTITGPSSFVCDCMSTAVFVKGKDEGSEFLNEYNSLYGTGYEAIFLEDDEAW